VGDNGALVASGCADELLVYLAPRMLGHLARSGLELPDYETLEAPPRWTMADVRQLGDDLRVILRPASA